MNEHHFNFLNQEDIKKQFAQVLPPQKLPQVMKPLTKSLDVQKKDFIAERCPDWAKPENSDIVWEYKPEVKDSLGIAARKLNINLTKSPLAYYKASLLDNWLYYENGYIARYNEGSSEIRRLNDTRRTSAAKA